MVITDVVPKINLNYEFLWISLEVQPFFSSLTHFSLPSQHHWAPDGHVLTSWCYFFGQIILRTHIFNQGIYPDFASKSFWLLFSENLEKGMRLMCSAHQGFEDINPLPFPKNKT